MLRAEGLGSGFRVEGLGFGVLGLGFGVCGLGVRVWVQGWGLPGSCSPLSAKTHPSMAFPAGEGASNDEIQGKKC